MSRCAPVVWALVAAGLATACVSVPSGPGVMVLPGSAVTFEQFQADDAMCRAWAEQQCGKSPNQVATEDAVTGAAVGTAVGAASGAAIGAAAGNPAAGAAVGAGSGLLLGTAAGSSRGTWSANEMQRRYDTAYMQCMYAKGNQIPFWGEPARGGAQRPPPQPSPRRVPPPPAGPPPPPPPGAG
jgi:outer membrane lipoprotein SlyB